MKEEYRHRKHYLHNKFKLILAVLILSQLISCKKDTNEDIKHVKFGKTNIVFPDTLILNKKYKGYVLYNSLFDTLNLKIGEDRYINLYVRGDNRITEYDDVKKIAHDTFVIYKDTIRFIVDFDKIGKNYLNGYIEDEVYIEDKDSTRIMNKIIPFHKPVYVKEE